MVKIRKSDMGYGQSDMIIISEDENSEGYTGYGWIVNTLIQDPKMSRSSDAIISSILITILSNIP